MGQKQFHKEILPLRHGLYRYALKLLSDQDEALDAVQDVLLNIWENRHSLDRIDQPKSYCMRAIRNQCFNALKQRKRFVSEKVLQNRENGAMDPMEQTHSRQMVRAIKRSIDSLPETQRSCLHLREIEGMKYAAISDTLELSMSQVKVNIHRGRKKVQDILNEKEMMS